MIFCLLRVLPEALGQGAGLGLGGPAHLNRLTGRLFRFNDHSRVGILDTIELSHVDRARVSEGLRRERSGISVAVNVPSVVCRTIEGVGDRGGLVHGCRRRAESEVSAARCRAIRRLEGCGIPGRGGGVCGGRCCTPAVTNRCRCTTESRSGLLARSRWSACDGTASAIVH